MKKLFLFLLICAGPSAMAQKSPAKFLYCESIGSTFRPFYKVTIENFDVAKPNLYSIKVEKIIDLEGNEIETTLMEGHGTFQEDQFAITFGNSCEESLSNESDGIRGKIFSNGMMPGLMNFGGQKSIEVWCPRSQF